MEGVPPKTRLQAAVDAGLVLEKLALFFGCWDRPGHYLRNPNCTTTWSPKRDMPGFPWSDGMLDGGLLNNGKRPDVYDGKVFWTVGGSPLWYAFFWWDRSGDSRGASNSGFYVRGFGWPEAQAAFDYAGTIFPRIIARQHHPLVLQNPQPSQNPDEGSER